MLATITRFLDAIAYERGLAANTRQAYGDDLRAFTAFLAAQGVRDFAAVTRRLITAFLDEQRRQGMSAATMARRFAAIKGLFGYLVADGALERNVTDVMRTPKTWRNLPGIISPDETARLIETAIGVKPHPIRDRAILELFYACGLRVSEVATLRLEDTHLEEGFVRCTGKGNKQRVVPLGGQAAEALRRYLTEVRPQMARNPSENSLFVSQWGRGFTRQGLYKIVLRYAREAGLRGRVTPHTLRHCFASHLLANGASLRAIQEMLGHASIATTQIYTHVDPSHLLAVHRQFHPRA